jgi:hypothetical protein
MSLHKTAATGEVNTGIGLLKDRGTGTEATVHSTGP